MARFEKTRADDELELEVLHLRENKKLKMAVVRERCRVSTGFISGLQNRVRKNAARHPCQCRRKANRDGGMRQRWWSS